MKSKKTYHQTSWACVAALIGIFLLIGCERSTPETTTTAAPDPASPASYMKDPVFREMLKERDAGRKELMKSFAETRAAYEAACKEDSKGAKAAELKAKLDALNAEYNKQRLETTRLVRERLLPKAPKAK